MINKLPNFYENQCILKKVMLCIKTLVFTEIVTKSTTTTTTNTTTTDHKIGKPLVAKTKRDMLKILTVYETRP